MDIRQGDKIRILRAVIASIDVPFFVVDREERIMFMSKAAGLLFKADPRSQAGRRIPDMIPGLVQLVHESVASGQHKESELVCDGASHQVLLFPFELGATVLCFDTTKKRNKIGDLEHTARIYRSLVENSPVGIYRSSIDGEFLIVNDALAGFFGFESKEELMSVPAGSVYHDPEDRKAFIAALQMGGKVSRYGQKYRTSDGRTKFAVESASLDQGIISGTVMDITEYVEVQEQLLLEKQKLDLLMASTQDLIFLVDDSMRFLYVCPAAEQTFDANLVGKGWADLRLPDRTRSAFIDASGECIRRQVSITIEIPLDGKMLEFIFQPIEHGLIVAGRDITERRKAEGDLRQSERKLKTLIETANSIIVRWSPDFTILDINQYGLDRLGYRHEELIGSDVRRIFKDPGELDDMAFERYRAVECRNISQEGNIIWVSWTNQGIFDSEGNLLEVLGIGNDITALKLKEEELERTNELKSSVLRDTSYQLIGSIGTIRRALRSIIEGPPGDAGKHAETAMRCIEMYERELSSIIELSRLEYITSINKQPVSLNGIIKEVAGEHIELARKKGLHLSYKLSEIKDLDANRDMMASLVRNLLLNALKYTDRGSVMITTAEIDGGIQMIVSDTGRGIPAKMLSKIFEPYCKVHPEDEGLGLGLSICEKIVRLHDGDIRVDSEADEGSRFIISLPY